MRQVAKHIYIREILDGEYEEREGWDPNVLHTARGDVSRVNVIGAFLSAQGQQLLDDGTGQIALRAFEDVPGLRTAQSGAVVQVIGRPRRYNDQLLLIPEVVRTIDGRWAQVRRRDLGEVQEREQAPPVAPAKQAPAAADENRADRIVTIISEMDAGDGAAVDEVIAASAFGDAAERIIEQLLLEGEIFEIRPGIVKVL